MGPWRKPGQGLFRQCLRGSKLDHSGWKAEVPPEQRKGRRDTGLGVGMKAMTSVSGKSDSEVFGAVGPGRPQGLPTKVSAAYVHEGGLGSSDGLFSLVPLCSAGRCSVLESKQGVFSRTKERFLGIWEERESLCIPPVLSQISLHHSPTRRLGPRSGLMLDTLGWKGKIHRGSLWPQIHCCNVGY